MAGAAHRFVRSGTRSRSGAASLGSCIPVSPGRCLAAAITIVLLAVIPHTVPATAQGIAECVGALDVPTAVTSVYVQPDAGLAPVLDEIDQARCSIDLSMYLLTSDEIVAGLQYAEQRGVRVRVILEQVPFGTFGSQQEVFDTLVTIGADVKWSPDAFTFSHAKYMIVDERALVVTNQNFTGAGFSSNREFGVITTDPAYVTEAVQIFHADWNGFAGPPAFQHLVVSPVNSRQTILDMINSSTVSVWMYAEVLRDKDVTTALDNAVSRGVNVRLRVTSSADEEDAPYFLDVLDHGVEVRVLNSPYVHSKALIIDGTAVLIGSQNYSFTSLNLNREVGIVLTDAASLEIVGSTFLRDWSRAEPVDTIALSDIYVPLRLTPVGWVGKLSSGRWGVV